MVTKKFVCNAIYVFAAFLWLFMARGAGPPYDGVAMSLIGVSTAVIMGLTVMAIQFACTAMDRFEKTGSYGFYASHVRNTYPPSEWLEMSREMGALADALQKEVVGYYESDPRNIRFERKLDLRHGELLILIKDPKGSGGMVHQQDKLGDLLTVFERKQPSANFRLVLYSAQARGWTKVKYERISH